MAAAEASAGAVGQPPAMGADGCNDELARARQPVRGDVSMRPASLRDVPKAPSLAWSGSATLFPLRPCLALPVGASRPDPAWPAAAARLCALPARRKRIYGQDSAGLSGPRGERELPGFGWSGRKRRKAMTAAIGLKKKGRRNCPDRYRRAGGRRRRGVAAWKERSKRYRGSRRTGT